jgi:putative transposase
VVEAERHLRACEAFVESAPLRAGLAEEAARYPWSSAAHHLGLVVERFLKPHPGDWLLGNTPFEREVARKLLLQRGLSAAEQSAIASAVAGGWALGSEAFVARIEANAARRARRGRPGRPVKTDTAASTGSD